MSDGQSEWWNWPEPATRLEFDDQFDGLDATVGEFWRWGFSDLRMNIVRGVLAEFLVHKAIGAKQAVRNPWDDWDVEAPDRTKIEVKSSGYLQSWPQRRPSTLTFGRLRARSLDPRTQQYGEEAKVRADVFVFAAHMCREPEPGHPYPMLDPSHWRFWVASKDDVERCAAVSVGIEWVRGNGREELRFEDLAEAIKQASSL